MNIVDRIIENDMCLGCGICETLYPDKCKMKTINGFYYPTFSNSLNKYEENLINKVCPGVSIDGEINHRSIWGNYIDIKEAWSNDSNIRYKASSGGVVSSLAIYLLENNIVDGVFQVGVSENSILKNRLMLSKSKNEIIRNSGSRYAPADIFSNIRTLFDSNKGQYAFIGKPCDIAGLKNIFAQFPEYLNKVKYTIAIFCAGMPSYVATEKLLSNSNILGKPISVDYRGYGWPGRFIAKYKNKLIYSTSYEDSWGKVLGKHINLRCKICPDGIGMLADISIGDAWKIKSGKLSFDEDNGRSVVLLRTDRGRNIFLEAVRNKYLVSNEYDIKYLQIIQEYQYFRRQMIGYRFLPIQFFSKFLLSFKNVGLLHSFVDNSIRKGIIELFGTIIRYKRRQSLI